MVSQVICISRTTGAGAEAVAANVAEQLGFRYVDDQIVLRAAAHAGVSAEEVAAAEHKKPLIDRILDAFASAGGGVVLPSDVAVIEGIDPWVRNPDYEQMIRGAIERTADEGKAVIVAHAASMALAGDADVLRVLITASPETRAARLAEAEGLSESDARKAVSDSDKERRDYLRRFYDIDAESPTDYDLVVNTDAISNDQATAAVLNAASA